MSDTRATLSALDTTALDLAQLRDCRTLTSMRTKAQQLRARLVQDLPPDDDELTEVAEPESLSAWLIDDLEQISQARTIERARYYLNRTIRALEEVRTSPINDINLNRWKAYEDLLTDSLWLIDRRDRSGVHTADYWGNFIPQIPNQLMRRFTKKDEWVLDVFAGLGTTLIEGQRLGRNTIGIEIQPTVAARARDLIAKEPNVHQVTTEIIEGDSTTLDYTEVLGRFGRKKAQLVVMHPPYWDIIPFSSDPRDLSNAPSADDFVQGMTRLCERVLPVLQAGRYLALVIGDKYSAGEWLPLGFLTMQALQQCGLRLKSVVVKNFDTTAGKRRQKSLWRYRALAGGFYVFKHEYIFLLQKPK